jgi:hypothetical protein
VRAAAPHIRIPVQIADQQCTTGVEKARLMAQLNLTLASPPGTRSTTASSAGRCSPREADLSSCPTGAGDGNPATLGDGGFVPLAVPANSLDGPNLAPASPANTCGHAAFGGALFQTERLSNATDRVAFALFPDEFNRQARDIDSHLRPLMPRYFAG